SERLEVDAMARTFVVVRETIARESDLDDAAGEINESDRIRLDWRLFLRPPIRGSKRVHSERVLDVRQDQLLMLLLVMEAHLDERASLLHLRGRLAMLEKTRDRLVDVPAIGAHLIDGGPRQSAPPSSLELRAEALVVGIEEAPVAGVKRLIVPNVTFENERLEEPHRVREVPPGRARVGQALDHLILDRERRREIESPRAYREVVIESARERSPPGK